MSGLDLRRRIDNLIVALGERSSRRIQPGFPYAIRLDHPPTADLNPRYGFGRASHPKLEEALAGGIDRYRSELERFGAYFDELASFSLDDERSEEPCWVHPWLIGLDTVSLYGYVRSREPSNYVEIGSGQSTKVVARARHDGRIATRITSVDPRPRSEVDGLCDTVIRMHLEQVDIQATFGGLSRGDVVFFDGSHRVLPNSDCVAFYLDVLPALPPGVLVGIHDIYIPDDYPPGFFEMWWSEQYLLGAVLLAGAPWLEVVLPAYYASGLPELSAVLDPLFCRPRLRNVNRRGSVFWLETREATEG